MAEILDTDVQESWGEFGILGLLLIVVLAVVQLLVEACRVRFRCYVEGYSGQGQPSALEEPLPQTSTDLECSQDRLPIPTIAVAKGT